MLRHADPNAQTSATRTAVVTGGAGTLGAAIARLLVQHAYQVAIVDSQADQAKRVVEQLRASGGDADFFELDVRDALAWQALREELQARWPLLDVLVNAAGITVIGDFCQTEMSQQRQVIDVNLLGTMTGCHAMCPWLMTHPRRSHLINIASCMAFLNFPWAAAYNASKAGVLALSETLAAEFTNSPLHVCAVCPGFFESQLFAYADQHDLSLMEVVGKLVSRSELTADHVARRVWHAMQRNKPYVIVPRRVAWMCQMKRLFPARTMSRVAAVGQKLRAKGAAKAAARRSSV